MKKYIAPEMQEIVMEIRQSILAGSLNVHDKPYGGKGEGVGTQFTGKKGQNIWDSKDAWE